MRGKIVEDDDVPRSQCRHQDLLNVRAERGGVDRSIEDGRGGQLGRAEGRDHRVRLPVAAGRVICDARAPGAARVPTQQVGGNARLIHEHIAAGIVERERRTPSTARGGDLRSPLFVGVYGFF